MEKEAIINDATDKLLSKVRVQMEEAFTLGMKYMKLSIVDKLLPILQQNEFDDNAIAIVLRDIGALEELTYADVFTDQSN
jgi:hypothetical protein